MIEVSFYLLIALFVGMGLAYILLSVCDIVKTKGYNGILENLKKYKIPIVIVLLLFVSVIIPIVAWYHGSFNKDRILHSSDLLGYYGALIGGGITILGIYWTFNYERVMSVEERKETSIPIFTFTIELNSHDLHDIDYSIIGYSYDSKIKAKYENTITRQKELVSYYNSLKNEANSIESELSSPTSKDREELKKMLNKNNEKMDMVMANIVSRSMKNNIRKLSMQFSLTITNIGLQSAILDSINYIPEGPLSSLKGSFKENLNYLSVKEGKEKEINILIESYLSKKDYFSTNFDKAGYLELMYTDLYRNLYSYKVPIKIRRIEEMQMGGVILMDKYEIIIDAVNLPIRPKDNQERVLV
jgi:hypothetical protein